MLRCLAALVVAGALILGGGLVGPTAEAGFEVDRRLEDPAQEARARELHKQLRCLVCQNQSIADSNAELARDLRQVVRERIVAGDSDDEAIAYLSARYGDWVLLAPPFKASTLALWLGPLLVLAVAVGGVGYWYRRGRGRRGPEAAPLNQEERHRLDALLEARDDA